LLADEKRLSELSRSVRMKAVKEHSWVSRAESIKSIYLNLLLKANYRK